MMRLHYNDLIKISRLKTVSGNRKSYVATATADASIQALGKEGGQLDEGVFGNTYIAYVEDGIPANKADRVKDQNDNIYSITDVVIHDQGAFTYKELILKKT